MSECTLNNRECVYYSDGKKCMAKCIAEKDKQIEAMKNCENCKHFSMLRKGADFNRCKGCKSYSNWELPTKEVEG